MKRKLFKVLEDYFPAIGSPAFLMIPEKSAEKGSSLLFLQFACGEEGVPVLVRMNLLPAWAALRK